MAQKDLVIVMNQGFLVIFYLKIVLFFRSTCIYQI